MVLYDSIIPCFGSRLTVVMMPEAGRYHVHPLGTFHFFDWQKTENVGISIGTCPQIVSSQTAQIGIRVGETTRMLPFAEDSNTFSTLDQNITPLKTIFTASDSALPLHVTFTFRSAFYPQSFEFSCPPAYCIEIAVKNTSDTAIEAEVFFGLPLANAQLHTNSVHCTTSIEFPAGIDHAGIDNLTFEQIIAGDGVTVNESDLLSQTIVLQSNETQTVRFYHAGYIAQPTLNQQGLLLRFGYTTIWRDAADVLDFWRRERETIIRKSDLFESTVMEATVAPELKQILSAAFKGLACNSWWAEEDWFSVMEIGAYHSTLDVDFQLALFFFQYWPDLIKRMLNQWAQYYKPTSGYMAHDVGQHLEVTGNRYGGPESAMKVEENCNYLILLRHYWVTTGDNSILDDKLTIVQELVDFLIAADTTGSGLPNRFADNTNDWGSGLITASEEQSYHGVRLIAAYVAAIEIAKAHNLGDLEERCLNQLHLIQPTMAEGWLGDHYPISFSDPDSFHHYSMWTTHGLLYFLREGQSVNLDIARLRTDLINSTQHTMREHGCVHSTVDVRGWITQNLWRDCIAAYLGIDMTNNLRRYLGHGEYMSYEDTTILEVANELMVVPGATAEHTHAGETHDFPMVDGHPRPACGFGLLYALAGVQFNYLNQRLAFSPIAFPLRIALTHLADWDSAAIPWVTFKRSIPNQDKGYQPASISYTVTNEQRLANLEIGLESPQEATL